MPPPLPDRISLVTVLVIRKVTSMAMNIHIIGRSDPLMPIDTLPGARE